MAVFDPVSPNVDFRETEEAVLTFWQGHDIFKRSMEWRRAEGAEPWVFYEGPPTANGLPHVGHVFTRVYKDLFPRYRTMKGYYVLRKAGWDTHGLPVEIEVEKELGLSGKQEIEAYGVAEFNERCRASVFRYVEEWRKLTDRIGFWIDLDDPYITMTTDYIESVWSILKNYWERDLLYQGYKVVPYCPRCGTPLSDHEVSLGYATTIDPSVYVKFPLRDESGTYFLVWTTTPWTLPGNVALAVGRDIDYVKVRQGDAVLILAQARAEAVLGLEGAYQVLETMKGKELVGKRYQPLFRFLPMEQDNAYVVEGDFVSTEDGTGIVHIAPAFGAEDMDVARQYDLPVLMTVNPAGEFTGEVTPYAGQFVKEADPQIIEDLRQRGLLYEAGVYEHTYPFCWRCGTPLLYYARTTWYIETTRYKQALLDNNNRINWVPDSIRTGRFGNWLENNVDWALGRERYWATPLPVWVCERCNHPEAIGSRAELEERAGHSYPGLDLHRPWVDEVTFPCPTEGCGDTMRRVPEVIDVWFDSGSMPYAQWHYPFENQELFEQQYPADFICEAVDQTRGWFYSLHAISTLLFNQPAFTNVIVLGHVLDEQGRKMSKSLGNRVDPWDVINVTGADAMRWYFVTASPPWTSSRFGVNLVSEVVRKFMLTLWNTYSFFVTYANIAAEKLEGSPLLGTPFLDRLVRGSRVGAKVESGHFGQSQPSNLLDRWLLSELHRLIRLVDERLEHYDATTAGRAIAAFVDELSNWYVRRNRRRFWEDDPTAFATLHKALVTLSQLLAPFTPFLAETLYQNLVRRLDASAPESVHLTDFPVANPALIDEALSRAMALVQQVTSLGHAARNKAGIKVRQPLQAVAVSVPQPEERAALERLKNELLDELNVKELQLVSGEELASYRINPNPARLGPRLGKTFPRLRAALKEVDNTPLARALLQGESVEVPVDAERVTLYPDEIAIEPEDRPGYAVVSEGPYTVAVTTAVTSALRREGQARELARQFNQLRKQAGLELTDRITAWIAGPVGDVLAEWSDVLKRDILAIELHHAPPPANTAQTSVFLDGTQVTLGVRRVEQPGG
ncbi:MAG: isoleucine--tRNA ligase [Ardenticatenaceae bacterium]|nr:isoleucine--tRNA ligase [Ardenticatenaceae bacterium]HBY98417.1 isoleucine--tRNA ligase [Chloroflexota bacterium]